MDYKAIKEELKRRRENTRYFNREFYNLFIAARAERIKASDAGDPDKYEKDGITLFHSWDPVYNSRFYKENSACYCEFLSIV